MVAKSIATTPSNSLPPNYPSAEIPATPYTISLILVGLAIIAAIASAIYDRIPKIVKPSFKPKLKDRVPCDRCHYFSHSHYLKCAIHPDRVMTEQAVDCRDYDLIGN